MNADHKLILEKLEKIEKEINTIKNMLPASPVYCYPPYIASDNIVYHHKDSE